MYLYFEEETIKGKTNLESVCLCVWKEGGRGASIIISISQSIRVRLTHIVIQMSPYLIFYLTVYLCRLILIKFKVLVMRNYAVVQKQSELLLFE